MANGEVVDIARQVQMKRLMEQAKRNNDALNGCSTHYFDHGDEPITLGVRLTCSNCGGTMDGLQVFRYCQGFQAAGGDPDAVLPGYSRPRPIEGDKA